MLRRRACPPEQPSRRPLAFSSIYFGVRAQWPGAIWLSALVVYAIMVPLVIGLRFTKPAAVT